MSSPIYYLSLDEEQLGPYTRQELEARAADRAIAERAFFWCEGLTEWEPLASLAPMPPVTLSPPPPIGAAPKKSPSLRRRLLWISLCSFAVTGAVLAILIWKSEKLSKESGEKTFAEIVMPEKRLNGSVFIVTKGGQSFKLGLVAVGLMRKQDVEKSIREVDARLKDRRNRAKALSDEAEKLSHDALGMWTSASYNSPNYEMMRARSDQASKLADDASYVHRATLSADRYFEALPAALTAVKTDADGRFTIGVPGTGEFVLAARATRQVGEDQEIYDWIIYFPKEGPVTLSNDNLAETGAKDSVIYAGESSAKEGGSRTLESLEKLLAALK